MRKIFKILTTTIISTVGVLPMATSLTSCSKMYQYQGKLTDYLHEITYDDYREDTKLETIDDKRDLPASFGCSSVRKGNFYGRNFDYVYNDTPEFIVHVRANEAKQRHASIAVATHFGLREDQLLAGKYNKELELIPNLTMDGINDAGVVCSSNVVSMEPNEVEIDGKKVIPETHPDDSSLKRVHALFIPRYILDHATSADDAVDILLNRINVYGNLEDKHNLHIMVADSQKTFVIEFFHLPNSKHNHFDVVVDQKYDSPITTDKMPIMTNYYVNRYNHLDAFDNDEKYGEERYLLLKSHYTDEGVESISGMYELMQYATFSQAYSFNHTITPLQVGGDLTTCEWYSELWKQSLIKKWKPSDQPQEIKDKLAALQTLKEAYASRTRKEANPAYWITTHNSTYDIANKKLRITVQEQYTWYKEFSLQ